MCTAKWFWYIDTHTYTYLCIYFCRLFSFVGHWKILRHSLVHSGLMIWHCHCSGLGHCHGAGSVPGPGTFTYHGRGHKKEDIEYSSLCYTVCPCCLSLLNSAYMLNPTSFWSLLLAPSALLPPWSRCKKQTGHKKKKQKTKNKKHHCVIIGIFIPRAWQSIEEWKSENDMIRSSCFGSVVKNPA